VLSCPPHRSRVSSAVTQIESRYSRSNGSSPRLVPDCLCASSGRVRSLIASLIATTHEWSNAFSSFWATRTWRQRPRSPSTSPANGARWTSSVGTQQRGPCLSSRSSRSSRTFRPPLAASIGRPGSVRQLPETGDGIRRPWRGCWCSRTNAHPGDESPRSSRHLRGRCRRAPSPSSDGWFGRMGRSQASSFCQICRRCKLVSGSGQSELRRRSSDAHGPIRDRTNLPMTQIRQEISDLPAPDENPSENVKPRPVRSRGFRIRESGGRVRPP